MVIKRATLAPLPLAVSICCAVAILAGALGDGLTSFEWCVVECKECFFNFDFVRLSSSCDALPRPAVSGLALLPMVPILLTIANGVALAFALLCTY